MTLPRDKLVERIARAMCRVAGIDPDGPTCDIYVEGDPLAGIPWASYRYEINKTLSAIESAGLCIVPREPTEGMIQAVLAGLDDRGGRRYHNLGVFKEAWSCAIAAAGEG